MARKDNPKYVGRLGLHSVYRGGKGTFAIAQYSNLTEIVPVVKIKNAGWSYEKGEIKQIKRTGTFKSELMYAKKLLEK